jgi:transposase-like protein
MGAITAEVVDVGEKRDTRGRRVFPRAERRSLIATIRASGVTMAEFARREGINYSTMAG